MSLLAFVADEIAKSRTPEERTQLIGLWRDAVKTTMVERGIDRETTASADAPVFETEIIRFEPCWAQVSTPDLYAAADFLTRIAATRTSRPLGRPPTGRYNTLSDADHHDIIERGKAGERQQTIADNYGVSVATISKLLTGAGLVRGRGRPQIHANEEARHAHRVQARRDRYAKIKAERLNKGESVMTYRITTEAELEEMIALRQGGMSNRDIAEKFDRHPSSVQQMLKRAMNPK